MRTFQRLPAVTGLAALAEAATAAPVPITANPGAAEPGSYTKVSFRPPHAGPAGGHGVVRSRS